VDHSRTSDLRVSVLRGVEVRRDEIPVEVAGRRLRSLLALLALSPGTPRRAEYLADQLWNGEPPSANALQALISRLRRIVGPDAVASRPTGYLLALDPARVDIARFDSLARERTPEAARAALALAGPEPLAEFADVPDLADEARRIEAECLKLADLADLAEAAPPAAPAAVKHRIGVRLIGRDLLLAEITARLATTRLLTLVGAGGAGKTSLAKAVAYARDGAVVAELAPVGAEAVAAEVLTAVGGRDMVVSDRARRAADAYRDDRSRIAATLRDRRMLLVLDNCEHVVDAAADLAALILDHCPEVTILTTSREPLAVPGEVRLPVDPLPVPPSDAEQDHLATYAAMQLLLERGRAVRPDLAAGGVDGTALAEICRRLDGSPLALELAAARFSALTPRQVADRLDDRFRLLTQGAPRTALPRQQTLRAVVDWSWELLDRQEREILALCSVFAGGTTLEDVEAVAGDPAALDVLDRLVVKSLVVAEPHGEAMHYRLLETIREYARERLVESGLEQDARDRHARWFARLAGRADGYLRGPDQVRWLNRLDDAEDNMRAALAWALKREDADTLMHLCVSLSWYWMLRGRNDGRRECRAAVELVDRVGTKRRMTFALLLALDALSAFEAVVQDEGKVRLNRARREFDRVGRRSTLSVLCEVISAFFERDTFLEKLDVADRRCVEAGDVWGGALLCMMRSRILADEDAVEAERYARMAFEQFRGLGDRWGMAETGQMLGYVESLRGEHRAALAVYAEAGRTALEVGAIGDMMIIAVMSVWEHEYLGEHEAADRKLDEAESYQGDPRHGHESAAFVTLTRAGLARARGDLEAAAAYLAEARRLQEHGRDNPFRVHFHIEAALLAAAAGRFREAADYYVQGLRAAIVFFFDAPEVARCVEGLAVVAAGLGEPQVAARLLGAAFAVRPVPLPETRTGESRRNAHEMRAVLGEDDFERLFAEGRALSREEAFELAREHATRYRG
jgi:predicted ATPase/tetratricopeptide (TPR) repeat protein